MRRLARYGHWFLLSWLLVLPAAAAQDPVLVVEEATAELLELIAEARDYYDSDPERFHREVDRLLSPVLDFDTFTRGVMGPYASQRYYESLSPEAKKRYPAQVGTFKKQFKQGLIETYAKGLLRFSGERIETLPLRPGEVKRAQVNVVQHIYGNAEKPYVVQYTLYQNRDSEWKARNVVVEGINLGLTYRNQFAALMEQHRGNLDKVIAAWRVEPAESIGEAG